MKRRPKPAFRLTDPVHLASHARVIPGLGENPAILHDTVLRVFAVIGKGSKRNPWLVMATDDTSTHFWYFNPTDLEAA